jgi:low temperature requirement protein LtrA
VLGEGVLETIGALSTLSSRDQLGGEAIALGLLGLGITFALCWIYFDFVARRAARGAFLAGLLWVYLHMSVLIGITLTGIGVSVAIVGSPSGEFGGATRGVLVAGVVVTLLAVAALQPTLAASPGSRASAVVCLATAVVLGVIGLVDLGAVAQFAVLLAGLVVPVAYGTRRVFG